MQILKYKCKYTNTNEKYTNSSQDFHFHRGGMPGLASVTDAGVGALRSNTYRNTHTYIYKDTNTYTNTQLQMQIHKYIYCKYTNTRQDFQFHRAGMPGLASVTDACVVGLPSRMPSHFQAFTSPLPVRACVHLALTLHTSMYSVGICVYIFRKKRFISGIASFVLGSVILTKCCFVYV